IASCRRRAVRRLRSRRLKRLKELRHVLSHPLPKPLPLLRSDYHASPVFHVPERARSSSFSASPSPLVCKISSLTRITRRFSTLSTLNTRPSCSTTSPGFNTCPASVIRKPPTVVYDSDSG